MSLTGSFLITMSFLIINGLGVEFAEMERSVVNTVMVQSATTTSAAASLVAYSSLHQTPLKFEILQGSLLVGGVTGGAIAATQVFNVSYCRKSGVLDFLCKPFFGPSGAQEVTINVSL